MTLKCASFRRRHDREICCLERNYSVLIIDSNPYFSSADFSTRLDFCNWKNIARVFEMTLKCASFRRRHDREICWPEQNPSIISLDSNPYLSSTDFSTRLDFCNWKNFARVFEMTRNMFEITRIIDWMNYSSNQ